MNINKILITGNVTADPEIRYTPNGKAVLSASLANNEYYTDAQGQEQKVTTFVNLEVWGKPAENFSKLVKKGQELFAEGKLRMDEWTDKQTSARRTRLYLLVENWQFTQYKRQEDNNTPEASPSAAADPSSPPPTRNQEIVENLKKPKRGTK
jgi:single-strand DNA-binding protein